ncbi:MAG: hypothetical protein AB7V08_13095 [Elusimicrobiales bacterium]
MNIISTLVLALGIAAPALASDFANLQNMDAAGISKINPFPNPSNPDSCYLADFTDGLCRFKCRSGETFQIKPVNPQADSLYQKCGAGDYRGANIPKVNPFPNPDSCYLADFTDGLCRFKCRNGETFQTKPVNPQADSLYQKCGAGDYRGANKAAGEQAYDSYGKYPSAEKAAEVMTWALNGFKFAKTAVTSQAVVASGPGDYRFRIAYKAAAPLAIESSPLFQVELDAYERMFDMEARLEDDGADVVTHEVVSYEGGYYYVLGYFQGSRSAARQAGKKVRACVFNSYANNVCNYKCSDGKPYTQPLAVPGPWNNNPVQLCPQLVFPL